jgi:hypothetical protein
VENTTNKCNVGVKILFEEGDTVRSLKGTLKSISPDFVELQTLSHEFFLVKTDNVIKIESLGRGEGYDKIKQ